MGIFDRLAQFAGETVRIKCEQGKELRSANKTVDK